MMRTQLQALVELLEKALVGKFGRDVANQHTRAINGRVDNKPRPVAVDCHRASRQRATAQSDLVEGGPALVHHKLIERDEVLVAHARIIPSSRSIGRDTGQGTRTRCLTQPGKRIGFPDARSRIRSPTPGHTLQASSVALKLGVNRARQAVDGELSGGSQIGAFAFAQSRPKNNREHCAGDNHGDRQPGRRGDLALTVLSPCEHQTRAAT